MIGGPTALELDFQRQPGQRARMLGRILLLVGAAALAAAGAQYASVDSERAALQASIDQARHARGNATPLRAAGEDGSEAAVKAANAVITQLAAPWGSFFAEIEEAVSDDVALLALQADPASDSVRLTGEARNFGAVTAYVRRLEATSVLREVTLSGHEVRQQDPQRPVGFVLSAKWERNR